MADSEEFVRLMESNAALVASLVQALQVVRPAPAPTPLQRFLGHPESPGDPTIDEWLLDLYVFVRQCGVPEEERACLVLIDYLGGRAGRRYCVSRRRFAGTSGSWCLCCGDGLGRGRPCGRCALSSIRGCSRRVRLLLSIAEFSLDCISA